MGTDKQRAVSSGIQFVLNAAQGRTIKRTVQGLGDHADAQGASTGQATSYRIGHKAQFGNRSIHGFLFVFTDRGGAIQYARHGTG